MAAQAFTRNHRDHSNQLGFQFEFFCDKCRNGYRSSYKTSKVGLFSAAVKAVGHLFGSGYRYGRSADHVKDALRGPEWDAAFKEAIDEMRPRFHQCTRCGKWVCPDVCWNDQRQLCEACAPDLAEEAGHIQAREAMKQAQKRASEHDQTGGLDMSAPQKAGCPECRARITPGAKFCASCGFKLIAEPKAFCRECGAQREAGARFCGGCGARAT